MCSDLVKPDIDTFIHSAGKTFVESLLCARYSDYKDKIDTVFALKKFTEETRRVCSFKKVQYEIIITG